jgi:membrane-associated phospholipid phosphatase
VKKSLFIYLLLLFELIASSDLYGQAISINQIKSGISYSINNNPSNLILIGGLLGSGISTKYDDKIQEVYQGKILGKSAAKLGDYWGIAGQFIILSRLKLGSDDFNYATSAIIANGLCTYGIKFITGRIRPDGANRRSFPSGHTSSSFLAATIADDLYGSKIGVPAYLLAGLTGLSRIHDNKHYLSDVIFGASLGIALGKGFGNDAQKKTLQKIDDGGIKIRINNLKENPRIHFYWSF